MVSGFFTLIRKERLVRTAAPNPFRTLLPAADAVSSSLQPIRLIGCFESAPALALGFANRKSVSPRILLTSSLAGLILFAPMLILALLLTSLNEIHHCGQLQYEHDDNPED